ncbi:MAG: Asp23/Gls24 family envelope stress response protein [Spirochaetes bacterium]|nr:Asp23/Gls24 family envelope stress response protein [Spirochaetota bacterium]
MWRNRNVFYDDAGIPHEADGDVRIANEVISDITMNAAAEVNGFVSFTEGIVDGFAKLLQGELAEGIYIRNVGKETEQRNAVQIDVSIIVQYGTVVQDVAAELQRVIKQRVEEMTGVFVARVNVNVHGISVVAKNKKEGYLHESD